MDKLYDSKFMKGLQRFGEKVASIKGFSALQAAFMGTMSIILVGAIFQIIASLLTLFKVTEAGSPLYNALMLPNSMTLGLISAVNVVLLSYNYAKALGMKPVLNAITGLLIFLIVAAPAKTVTLADGQTTFTGLDTTSLGASGLFTAILVGIISVRITHFCERKGIVVRMPDVVPQFLSDAFSSLIPLIINIIIWYGISLLISAFAATTLPLFIMGIISAPLAAINSIPGMVILFLIMTLLWTFGIHGTMVGFIAIMPVMMQAIAANGAAVAAGNAPVFYPVLLMGTVACAGGTGNTLALVLMGLRSKSEQLKAVGKAAIVPGLFNVNEPVAFGFPIMYNPVLAIPYILGPIVTMLVIWLGYAVGFFHPAYIMVMSLMPLGVGEFFGTLAWQNILIPVVGLLIGLLIYLPFFKVYERQLVAKEKAAKAETQNDSRIEAGVNAGAAAGV
jgi:PTS system cellobiose-specific IIC component